MTSQLPLDGIRIVDLTMMWAGPYATKLLADMGAEVIKIESPTHMDTIRTFVVPPPEGAWEHPWNHAPYFDEYNRNKLGLTLDIRNPKGREVFLRLVAMSDVVVENFRADVMDLLGLGYEVLKGVKDDIIMVSMPGYGKTGVDSGLVGYGPSIEEMAGLAGLNGDPDGRPLKTGISYGDPMAGVIASGAVSAALLHKMATGEGQYVEVPQRDVMIGVVGDAIMSWAMNAEEPPRTGNRDAVLAPQGCYRCLALPDDEAPRQLDGSAVTERWLTLTVKDDSQWRALCDVIGRADLAGDDRLTDAKGRQAHHDEIDAAIEAWSMERGDREAADLLLARGIPASAVATMVSLASDPHLIARGFLVDVEHPEGGTIKVTHPAWRTSDGGPPVRMPAPNFGRDNSEILTKVIGLSDDEVRELEEAGIISQQPLH